MTSKLITPCPEKFMVIRNVTPEILTLSTPFLRFGRIEIGGRATVVRLANGSLAVFSPVALTDEVRSRVASMGTVKYITASDVEHHIFMKTWHEAYPDAQLIAPFELKEKREKSGEPLPWTHLWTKDKAPSVDAEFDKEFDYTYVWAHGNKELVFNHRPTRTLIQADLLFNLPATEQVSKTDVKDPTKGGILNRIFNNLMTTQGTALAQRRVLWYAISNGGGDKAAFNRSAALIDGWDFDRIISCHGDTIETGGKGIFRKVFQWHLEAAKKSQ